MNIKKRLLKFLSNKDIILNNNKSFEGLMEGVAGIRGIVGKGLTPPVVCRYAAAYGKMMGPGEIIVGLDGRP